ncbi:hypothetical protein Tco_0160958 [Tanacetum coccineum]
MEGRLWKEFDNSYDEARKYAATDPVLAFNVVVMGDLLIDPDTMDFGEFMCNSFIPQIALQRRIGYLRLRLRTSALDLRQISIFIQKVDLYVIAVYNGVRLYEIWELA